MDTAEMAHQLRAYTSGYPYLVSRLCQLMDGRVSEKMGSLAAAWTLQGLEEAIKIMLADGEDTLFGSLMCKLNNSPTLKNQLREVLMQGRVLSWQPFDPEQSLLRMYGFIVNRHNTVAISNRIFEMRLYQSFLGETDKNDEFVLITKEDLSKKKSMFFDLVKTKDYDKKDFVFPKKKRIEISKQSIWLILLVIALAIVSILISKL
jgi:hypothetical protein